MSVSPLSANVYSLPRPPQSPLFLPSLTRDALNATVGGRLHRGDPYAKACFASYNGAVVERDMQACTEVQKVYFDAHRAWYIDV